MSTHKKSIVLEIHQLNVRRDIPILTNLNWKIKEGEHWVLLGQNGSGKTSLINVLNAYMSPSSGHFTVLGQQYGRTDWRDLRKSIGVVSSAVSQRIDSHQNALEIVMTGKDASINFWGDVSKHDKQKALKILKKLDCVYLANRPWKYLSLGERQRILIGRFLMAQLKILILDEPCAGLDPAARENFLDFIGQLANTNKSPTIIFVTHHVEEIIPCFTHVLLLKSGSVLVQGKKADVLTSRWLSKAFDSKINIKKRGKRFTVDFKL
jgi:iron complex transport system ATP-binding protein